MNYYNEFDRHAAAWLRELIRAGLIPAGDVDARDIREVGGHELTKYTQCHFFAGIGGWSEALRLAGWPTTEPVWTGSCPCQPFSAAGAQNGEADSRHLWPELRRLIGECAPPIVFGEQVASKLGREWLAGVRADLEGMAYAVGAADLCAASVRAPHIRQRLYFGGGVSGMANHIGKRSQGRVRGRADSQRKDIDGHAGRDGAVVRLADAKHSERRSLNVNREDEQHGQDAGRTQAHGEFGARGEICGLAVASSARSQGNLSRPSEIGDATHATERIEQSERHGDVGWDSFDVIPCLDGKARRVESGTFPLVARIPNGLVPSGDPSASYAKACSEGRVMRLRGYGNCIIPELASEFIAAFEEALNEMH